MSPTNTQSSFKRPVLAGRSASSHIIISSTRTSPANGIQSPNSQTQKPITSHKALAHRPHVVGGPHRTHGRNLSLNKNLNKLQKAATTHHLLTETPAIGSGIRQHHRKKSAPVTPAASPLGQHRVRWDGSTSSLLGDPKANTSMRKNYSTPALRRDTPAVLGKKALVTDRSHLAKTRVKKVVGFELGDSDSDGWEDSTQSPGSTRRNSGAPRPSETTENDVILVDPLTFVKRPYPHTLQSTSIPKLDSKSPPQEHSDDANRASPSGGAEQQARPPEHDDIASRLLNQSRPSKAPPTMSSISAMATPVSVDLTKRTSSLSSLASNHDVSRRAQSSSNPVLASPPAGINNAQATSSSMEGGVSHFIEHQISPPTSSRFDSDPNTPSSFLPHYHPQTPPSPNRENGAKKGQTTSPPPQPPGVGPPSRTQQKLWLQRTAALTTSPPEAQGLPSSLPPSSLDPVFGTSHPGTSSDGGRGAVNGTVRAGGGTTDLGPKHIWKLYDKTATELNVVRRFQSPTKDSFQRVGRVLSELSRPGVGTGPGMSRAGAKNAKSTPSSTTWRSLSAVPERRLKGGDAAPAGLSQLISRNRPQSRKDSTPHVYFQDHDDVVNIGEPSEPVVRSDDLHSSQRGSHQILSTSADGSRERVATDPEPDASGFPNEPELLLRRIWQSREVASAS